MSPKQGVGLLEERNTRWQKLCIYKITKLIILITSYKICQILLTETPSADSGLATMDYINMVNY